MLTVTPSSKYTNASGSGSFYLSSVSVTGIPTSCYGADFNISVYDSSAASPLAMFNTSSAVASVYDNAGTFAVGHGGSGYNNTSVLISAGDTQGAPSRAKAYTGPNGDTTGQWFVPSLNELNALYDSTAKALTTFNPSDYHASTQALAGSCKSINFANRSNNTQNCTVNNPYRVRPIRAF